MPVINKDAQQDIPQWSDVSRYGISYHEIGDEVELHYHDCNEYWVIVEGRGICTTGGKLYEIGPGDMVMTKMGDDHSLKVTEKMILLYIYGPLAPDGKVGHLHRDGGPER